MGWDDDVSTCFGPKNGHRWDGMMTSAPASGQGTAIDAARSHRSRWRRAPSCPARAAVLAFARIAATLHPLYTSFTERLGAAIYETLMVVRDRRVAWRGVV
jgi:hypothetical protein